MLINNTSKTLPRIEQFLEQLDGYEIPIVRSQTEIVRKPLFRLLAISFNHLGNGWLYPLWACTLLILQGWNALPVILVAGASLIIAHLLYPKLKDFIARPRPIDRYPELKSLSRPLDLYSFPSGHCMSAAAISIPVIMVVPDATLIILLIWLLIGWARLATGHHYPSDLIVGCLLGCIVTWPISQLYLI